MRVQHHAPLTMGPSGPPLLSTTFATAISRNYLCHYHLHRFLIATCGASVIYAHDHTWTGNSICFVCGLKQCKYMNMESPKALKTGLNLVWNWRRKAEAGLKVCGLWNCCGNYNTTLSVLSTPGVKMTLSHIFGPNHSLSLLFSQKRTTSCFLAK